MKKSLLKITFFTLLAVGIVGAPVLSRAADEAAAPAKKEKSSGGDKFYGPMTAVDAAAMTITVSDQVYTITSKTEITLAKDGSKATLADAKVGDSARGSFTKGADGKLEVTKVRFGKKSSATGSGGKTGGKKGKKSGATDGTTATAPQQ
jgi:hypothetical protein